LQDCNLTEPQIFSDLSNSSLISPKYDNLFSNETFPANILSLNSSDSKRIISDEIISRGTDLYYNHGYLEKNQNFKINNPNYFQDKNINENNLNNKSAIKNLNKYEGNNMYNLNKYNNIQINENYNLNNEYVHTFNNNKNIEDNINLNNNEDFSKNININELNNEEQDSNYKNLIKKTQSSNADVLVSDNQNNFDIEEYYINEFYDSNKKGQTEIKNENDNSNNEYNQSGSIHNNCLVNFPKFANTENLSKNSQELLLRAEIQINKCSDLIFDNKQKYNIQHNIIDNENHSNFNKRMNKADNYLFYSRNENDLKYLNKTEINFSFNNLNNINAINNLSKEKMNISLNEKLLFENKNIKINNSIKIEDLEYLEKKNYDKSENSFNINKESQKELIDPMQTNNYEQIFELKEKKDFIKNDFLSNENNENSKTINEEKYKDSSNKRQYHGFNFHNNSNLSTSFNLNKNSLIKKENENLPIDRSKDLENNIIEESNSNETYYNYMEKFEKDQELKKKLKVNNNCYNLMEKLLKTFMKNYEKNLGYYFYEFILSLELKEKKINEFIEKEIKQPKDLLKNIIKHSNFFGKLRILREQREKYNILNEKLISFKIERKNKSNRKIFNVLKKYKNQYNSWLKHTRKELQKNLLW